jgi:hypothetical protein
MVFFLIVYLILFWTIGVISGRYFDAKLISEKQKLPIVIRIATSRSAARATCYYACILMDSMKSKYMPKRMKRNYINNFGKTDYRALARKRDWVMAILFWGSALGFLITATTVCVISAMLGLH